jgi:hypothetical protein
MIRMLLAFCAVVALGLAAAWWGLWAPASRADILAAVRGAGFPAAVWVNDDTIHLDADGFSVLYGVRALPGGRIAVARAALMGEVGHDGAVTLAGWDGTPGPWPAVRADALDVELATPLGGVFLEGRAALGPDAAQATLYTEQAALSLHARVEATRGADGLWGAAADFDRGHIAVAGARLMRLSGTAWAGPTGARAEFAAGGMHMGGAPWQGVSGTVEPSGRVLLQARALGAPQVEIVLENRAGSLYAPNGQALAGWLGDYGVVGLPDWGPGVLDTRFTLGPEGQMVFE